MKLKKKIASGIIFIFLISLIGIIVWIGMAGKSKNIEPDLTKAENSIYETGFIDGKLETSSVKIIRQETLQDKIIFYLEDETELCISNADLIQEEEESQMVYEDSEKRIEFKEGTAVISKVQTVSEPFSQMSRKEKGE